MKDKDREIIEIKRTIKQLKRRIREIEENDKREREEEIEENKSMEIGKNTTTEQSKWRFKDLLFFIEKDNIWK